MGNTIVAFIQALSLASRVSTGRHTAKSALATGPEQRNIDRMARPRSPRVTFKMERIADGDWRIAADYPGAETRYIKGLKSKADVDDWLAGSRCIDWLRSQGYAK